MAVCLLLTHPARAEVEYSTQVSGLDGVPDGARIAADVKDASQLIALEEKKPPDILVLHRRAEADVKRLKEVLGSSGYYDAVISYRIDEKTKPVSVTIIVSPGARYTLDKIVLTASGGGDVPDATALTPKSLELTLGGPAIAAPIAAANGKIVTYYKNHGRPLAKIISRRAVIDVATKKMTVTYTVDAGLPARFGKLSIDGLAALNSRYVRRRVAWTEGEPYDQRLVDKTRDTLVTSGLFGAVQIDPEPPVLANGEIPMRIHSVERVPRTLSAGGSYNTSEGISADVSWEHRNLFGGAESLKLTALGGSQHNSATAAFRRPDLFSVNQDLVAKLSVDNELVNAFRSVAEQASLGIERTFAPGLTAGIGGLAEHARINEITDARVYTLVGIPITGHLDRSNDLLNPTAGFRTDATVTPYLSALGSDLTYAQAQISGTGYFSFDPKDAYVLALRGIAGGTFGTSLASIPKDHRFFAGGGGSVRGFGYQKASPLDQYYNPIGGRSLLVASAELRMRVTDTIGVVPFLDAAEVSAKEMPNFVSKPYAGAGIGLRYYTAIGPVRLDLATPLNPRSQGDSPIQIYVSLGQAF